MLRNSNRSLIQELAASESGMFTSGQAARMLIPRYALSYAVKSGQLERICHGAYRLADAVDDGLDELRAAYKLTAPSAFSYERMGASFDGVVVCGATAAYLHGIGDMQPRPWEIVVPKRFNSRLKSVRYCVRQIGALDVAWENGIPVTKPERTIADLVRMGKETSLIADVLVDAIRRYGATSFDVSLLKSMLGVRQLEILLHAAGIYEDGERDLVPVDRFGHVALREKDSPNVLFA